MAFDVPTIVAADNAGNDTDYAGWVKVNALIGAGNVGQLSGFRNRVINGDMAIDQRNAGAAVNMSNASYNYVSDRWATLLSSASSGTLTAQRTATAFATEARYCVRLARSAGSYTGAMYLLHVIETANCADLAGKKVILSFKARKGSAFVAGVTAYLFSGTGTDQSLANMFAGAWTGQATAASVAPTLTTSFQTFTVSATLGASVSQLGLYFLTGAFSGSGGANDYLDITDVQIEVCDATLPQSTPFERRPIGLELALCQRYYTKTFAQGTAPAQSAGDAGVLVAVASGTGTGCLFTSWRFPVTMRTIPTVTTYNPGAANSSWRNGGGGEAAAASANATDSSVGIYNSGTPTDATYYYIHASAVAEL
jgi:hypothetical protein